jgi:hypothetical protein
MIGKEALPQEGEVIVLPNRGQATVAWCSGWTWPLGYDAPTRLYVQAEIAGRVDERRFRVVAARDALGVRFWLAERRAVEV